MDQGLLITTINDAVKKLVKGMPDETYNDSALRSTLESNKNDIMYAIHDAAKNVANSMPGEYSDSDLVKRLEENNYQLTSVLDVTNSHLEDCSKALARCADALEEVAKLKKQKVYK